MYTLTSVVDFLGMGVSLWLALYFFGLGFSSRIILRGVFLLLACAAYFLVSYISLYTPITDVIALRAILFTISLMLWNDVTHKLLPGQNQKGRWLVSVIYAFGLITVIALLLAGVASVGQGENMVRIASGAIPLSYLIYSLFQLSASASILYGFYRGRKSRMGFQNRTFLVACLLAVTAVGYSAFLPDQVLPLPILIQDALIFGSMIALGISLERFQMMMERRRTLADFAISSLAVLWLSSMYVFIAWWIGFASVAMILVAVLSILTHSSYNLIREFLQRLRLKDEIAFHQQLRQLERNVQGRLSVQERLRSGLELLCQILESRGAFLAVQDENQLVVLASYRSLPIGFTISIVQKGWMDISPPPPEIADRVAWLVPACPRGEPMAVLGIGAPKGKPDYSETDLNLMAETADHMAAMIYLHLHKQADKHRPGPLMTDAQLFEAEHPANSNDLLHATTTDPDPLFIKIVEDGLRNLPNFILLGQSSLPEYLGIDGANQIERGKEVHQKLIEAIEVLRPAQDCPGGTIPREWYSYMILHDAYQKRIPNHDIMSRLYISEGTFHRTRRAAVRAVAQALLERQNSRERI